ncbi:Potassium-transporting ATPase ATP-binding subunit [Candidatus Gugararchaeum adminiculabundum]|nr:Potassium-transporting ATPase ATP-binding subunit [Candidatus Gugararchaeum adminiculabundum]
MAETVKPKSNFHAKTFEQTLKELGSSPSGMSSAQAVQELLDHGYNELSAKKPIPWYIVFIRQLQNPIILLLVVAAIISFLVSFSQLQQPKVFSFFAFKDSIAIMFAVLLSALFGFIQEFKAEKSLEALKRLTTPMAQVIRDGKKQVIQSRLLVPGDIIILEEGERVPADCRVFESIALACDESSLTGESIPVGKHPEPLPVDTSIPDMKNIAFMGTTVVRGRGKAVVIAVGMNTQFGGIAKSLEDTFDDPSPLQYNMEEIGKKVSAVGIALCVLFFFFGVLGGQDVLKMFLVAVTLAVAAVPEGLPTIMTITLAIGMSKMAGKKAIVRRLPAVETLGATTIICTDKTGTLTQNSMAVTNVFTGGKIYAVTGGTYDPRGEFLLNGKPIEQFPAELSKTLTYGALCCNATLFYENRVAKIAGDPTEGAVVVAAEKAGIETEAERNRHKFITEFPFDSARKMMSVLRISPDTQETYSFVKGAPEKVLDRCSRILDGTVRPLAKEERDALVQENRYLAGAALRVLAVAYKPLGNAKKVTMQSAESDLVFLGLVAMEDPPRKEVFDAISTCKAAGIRVVMITGDNEYTAKAIATQLGILGASEKIITGKDMDSMNETRLEEEVKSVNVFARTTSEHKLQIVSALRKQGEIVAVTGDGVNDAPAIKRANIGIAMGITGTEVTKEVADMVLADDNFATIVSAVRYGRNIYANITNFVRFQFSTNVAALATMFLAPLLTKFIPLSAIQILWINLIMDGPPALALGVEPADKEAMHQKPRDPKAPFLNSQLTSSIIFFGLLMCAGTVLVFTYSIIYESSLAKASTMAFTTFVLFQLFNAFNCKSTTSSILSNMFSNKYLLLAILASLLLQIYIVYDPYLSNIFGTVPLSWDEWAMIAGVAFTIVIFEEIRKFRVRAAIRAGKQIG